VLLARSGSPVEKSQLSGKVFPADSNAGPDAIELVLHRLRRKLDGGDVRIVTVRGLGYMLEAVAPTDRMKRMKILRTDPDRFGIRARLLTLLLPAILGLLALDSWNDYRALRNQVQDAYDQAMLESVHALRSLSAWRRTARCA
jgi:hypothetical protein